MKNNILTRTLLRVLVAILLLNTVTAFYLYRLNASTNKIDDLNPNDNNCEIVEHHKIYLAINEKYQLDDFGYHSNNPSIVSVNGDMIEGLSVGKTMLTKDCNTYEVEVTDLITSPFASENKDYLPCERYTIEENEYLDEVLAAKVKEKGYATRAGVVEAARFLLLQFPYKLDYFSENGRYYGAADLCEGEGRYYHEGLYLHVYKAEKEQFVAIINGPQPWGCSMFSIPAQLMQANSLDCSGFVTWAIVNGGFRPGDLGAGPDSENLDLTDLGTMYPITQESLENIKVGDLLSAHRSDAHVGILIGKKDGYYYIAESNLGIDVRVRVTTIEELLDSEFINWVDMDEYYLEDGKLTDYWIE